MPELGDTKTGPEVFVVWPRKTQTGWVWMQKARPVYQVVLGTTLFNIVYEWELIGWEAA